MPHSDPRDDVSRPWCPPVDIYRAGDHYIVKADLPGLDEEQISVRAKGNTLAISGDRGFAPGEGAEEHLRLELLHGPFVCEVHLPGIADGNELKCGYHAGVLEIKIPIK